MKIIRGIFILLVTSIFLTILLCTPPYYPNDNFDNVKLLIEVPKKPDGYNYCVNDTILFKTTLLFSDLVKKISIHFDENGDKDEREISTNKYKNEVIIFNYNYKEKGLKHVKFSITSRESDKERDTLIYIDIGVKPIIRNERNLLAVGVIKLDNPLVLSVKHEELGYVVYKWYKDSKILPGQDKRSLIFNPLKESDEGQYYCVITTNWGKDKSKIFNLYF